MIVTIAGMDAVDAGSVGAQMESQGGFSVSDFRARRRTAMLRTAKSCGPDAPVLASSRAEADRPNRDSMRQFSRR
jgi:uncharacterized protein YbjT (DUF2867 family)